MLEQVQPEALLLLGDTNSAWRPSPPSGARFRSSTWRRATAASTSACRRRSTAGSSTTSSDINLTYSEIARDYLLREGLPPDQVIKTGSPMREVIEHYCAGIDASNVLEQLGLQHGRYFVVSSHREENVDVPANLATLVDIAERPGGALSTAR